MTGSELQAVAVELYGADGLVITPVAGGGNNRVFRLHGPSGARALKLYPGLDDDPRDRLGHEFAGLRFARRAGARVPDAVARDDLRRCALYTWVEGEPAGPARDGDVAQVARLLGALHAARRDPAAADLPPAVEAVDSPGELERQLRRRLGRLHGVADGIPRLRSHLEALEAEMGRRLPAAYAAPSMQDTERTLSPSDFGLHNAVRDAQGLTFVDFEYFGWDDPVKAAADFLWHPGQTLRAADRLEFERLAADIYSADAGYTARFAAHFPLYGLRWALIVLNEFLSTAWERRRFAGMAGDRQEIEDRQLAKSAAILDEVRKHPSAR